mmetsp:Transcript_62407/g.92705  ORF Transcript_62407/g.92705 Transcript_62407/m.92705 type:complete len:244 (-) Transcript_62407:711-1442(-)
MKIASIPFGMFCLNTFVSADVSTLQGRATLRQRPVSLCQDGSDHRDEVFVPPITIVNANPNVLTGTKRTTFYTVVFLSLANILFNILRPDPAIFWQARVPRVLWEFCIGTLALLSSSSDTTPASYFLLVIITGATALIDIFFWAPVFAFSADFEECTGGGWFSQKPKVCRSDYIRGVGRLTVSAQSLFGGLFYLHTAIVAWGAFLSKRDEQVAQTNAKAMAAAFGVKQNEHAHIPAMIDNAGG